jgi:NIMA (never in mitosis gene a)-related kinase
MAGSIWLEYCDAGDFHDLIGRHIHAMTPIGERFIWKVFYQIASALKFCHGGPGGRRSWRWNTTVHRDLKPGKQYPCKCSIIISNSIFQTMSC